MSFDLPASVARDLELYAQAEHISPAEAAIKIIQDALAAKEDLVSDEQVRQLKALDGTFGLLEDVPEEQIDRMSATIERMKREGFAASV